jgi:hypothetical protein
MRLSSINPVASQDPHDVIRIYGLMIFMPITASSMRACTEAFLAK